MLVWFFEKIGALFAYFIMVNIWDDDNITWTGHGMGMGINEWMNERSDSYENKHNTTEEQQTNLTRKNRCADGAERNSNKSISILNVDGWVLFLYI